MAATSTRASIASVGSGNVRRQRHAERGTTMTFASKARATKLGSWRRLVTSAVSTLKPTQGMRAPTNSSVMLSEIAQNNVNTSSAMRPTRFLSLP